MILTDKIQSDLRSLCLKHPKIECCGILVDFSGEIKVLQCNNRAKNPKKDFFIDRKELNEKIGDGKLLAYFHSQSDSAEPSIEDIAVANKLNLISIIINNTTKEIKVHYPDVNFIPSFENRPFIAGYLDCSTLVRDYYKKTLNIELPMIEHPIKHLSWSEIKEKWNDLQDYNKSNYLFLLEYFQNNGFVLIDKAQIKKHDIILCRAVEIEAPVHALIYLGNNILHHPSERKSCIEQYSPFYKKLTTHCLRHNSNI